MWNSRKKKGALTSALIESVIGEVPWGGNAESLQQIAAREWWRSTVCVADTAESRIRAVVERIISFRRVGAGEILEE